MALTEGIEGGNADIPQSTSSSEVHLQELRMSKQDGVSCEKTTLPIYLKITNFTQKPFPFFRLPGEVRNYIYWEVLSWDVDRWEGPRLLGQPAITRVSRQTRAEALELYYHYSSLDITTSSSAEWAPFVQKVLDVFNGGPRGLPDRSRSTLQLLGRLRVSLSTTKVPKVWIDIELSHSPEDAMTIDPEDDCEAVVVGSPDMDWTDAAAVQAACDEAAKRLADDITRRTTPDEEDVELVVGSTPADQIAGLDALRLFALACPYLRPSVYICDNSDVDIYDVEDGYSTDEYPDGYEYPATDSDEDFIDGDDS